MTATEWVPGRWDDVHLGQTVCLRNDDGAEVEIVVDDRSAADYPGKWLRSKSCRYSPAEWSLFVQAPLPTEPGYYRVSGSYASVKGTLQLDTSGQWWWVGNEFQPQPEKIPTNRVSEFAPLTRLESVPVTNARILPNLEEVARCIARSVKLGGGDVTTVDVRRGRRILADLIAELGVAK